jgi:hypothetical protein
MNHSALQHSQTQNAAILIIIAIAQFSLKPTLLPSVCARYGSAARTIDQRVKSTACVQFWLGPVLASGMCNHPWLCNHRRVKRCVLPREKTMLVD